MPTYTAYLPVFATGKFTLTTDEPIAKAKLVERFMAEAEPFDTICYQCANAIESDFIIDEEVAELSIGDILVKG